MSSDDIYFLYEMTVISCLHVEYFYPKIFMENKVEYSIFGQCNFEVLQPFYQKLTKDYIWQREPFGLQKQLDCLNGTTLFGDCIQDEWFIVYILHSISLEFPGLVISVVDNDGQFLLIEAAQELPKGIEPEFMDDRVFIYQGNLHIIPLNIPISTSLQAIEVIKSPTTTQSSQSVQDAALKRALVFPGQIDKDLHTAEVLIPHLAAHLLYFSPGLIAKAVESFCSRDPLSMKCCSEMKKFDPASNTRMSVRFTKTLFAEINSAIISAPPKFTLPAKDSPEYKAAHLGMKIVSTFD